MISAMTSVDRNWPPSHENAFYSANKANAAIYCSSTPSLLTYKSIIQECSDTFILLTGYSPLELIGKSFASFLHPDDLYHHRQQQETQRYQPYHLYSHQAPTTSTIAFYRFYKKSGTTIPLEYRQGPNHSGKCQYVGFAENRMTPNSVPGSDIHVAGLKSDFENSSCCMNSSVIPHASVISPASKPIPFYVSSAALFLANPSPK
jgi:PAS domain S-box-containing protein